MTGQHTHREDCACGLTIDVTSPNAAWVTRQVRTWRFAHPCRYRLTNGSTYFPPTMPSGQIEFIGRDVDRAVARSRWWGSS